MREFVRPDYYHAKMQCTNCFSMFLVRQRRGLPRTTENLKPGGYHRVCPWCGYGDAMMKYIDEPIRQPPLESCHLPPPHEDAQETVLVP